MHKSLETVQSHHTLFPLMFHPWDFITHPKLGKLGSRLYVNEKSGCDAELSGTDGPSFKGKILASITKSTTVCEREMTKLSVPVLKTRGLGFTCIYAWIMENGEEIKDRSECWMEEKQKEKKGKLMAATTLSPSYPLSVARTRSLARTRWFTNSLLTAGIWYFGQLAIFGQPAPSFILSPLCHDQNSTSSIHTIFWSEGCHGTCFLTIAITLTSSCLTTRH